MYRGKRGREWKGKRTEREREKERRDIFNDTSRGLIFRRVFFLFNPFVWFPVESINRIIVSLRCSKLSREGNWIVIISSLLLSRTCRSTMDRVRSVKDIRRYVYDRSGSPSRDSRRFEDRVLRNYQVLLTIRQLDRDFLSSSIVPQGEREEGPVLLATVTSTPGADVPTPLNTFNCFPCSIICNYTLPLPFYHCVFVLERI